MCVVLQDIENTIWIPQWLVYPIDASPNHQPWPTDKMGPGQESAVLMPVCLNSPYGRTSFSLIGLWDSQSFPLIVNTIMLLVYENYLSVYVFREQVIYTYMATSCVTPVTKCWPGSTVYKFVVLPLWPEPITNIPYILNSLW